MEVKFMAVQQCHRWGSQPCRGRQDKPPSYRDVGGQGQSKGTKLRRVCGVTDGARSVCWEPRRETKSQRT